MDPTLPIALAIIIGLMQYFDNMFCFRCAKRVRRDHLVSFSAGVGITYLFLQFLPDIMDHQPWEGRELFVFVLLGFTSFHLIEKYIYKHDPRSKRFKHLRHVHKIAFFVYHFAVGIVMVELLKFDVVDGLLFAVVISVYTILTGAQMHDLHKHHHGNAIIKVILATATILGVIIAIFYPIAPKLQYALLGFVAGVIIFVVVKESVPRGKQGQPLYFLAGMATIGSVIALMWIL